MYARNALIGILALTVSFCTQTLFATDVKGLNVQGEPSNLESLIAKQQWNIVMVWASYCSACKRDFPAINEFIRDHPQSPIRFVGIALDGSERIQSVQKTVEAYQLEFDSIISDANDFGGFYLFETDRNFAGTPTYMVYNPSGMLVAHGNGPLDFKALERFIENQR